MLRRADAAEVIRVSSSHFLKVAPGISLCVAIAAVALAMDISGWTRFEGFFVPPLIIALAMGMALQPISASTTLKDGIEFSARTLLRVGVALLGVRLTLGELVEGGVLQLVVAVIVVVATILVGASTARLFGVSRDFGILTGCATGVCGAAAAMATSAVLPKHANSERDLAFTVIGVNFISTIAMVVYPTLQQALGYTPFEMGVFLGGSIHDVAQVAGAGQTMGPEVLGVSIVTKLLRVALLLPAVIVIAWWVMRGGRTAGEARPTAPIFLFGFLAVATLNSFGFVPAEGKTVIAQLSVIFIISAIAALGIKTSLRMLVRVGWPSVMLLLVETIFVALLVAGMLYSLRWH